MPKLKVAVNSLALIVPTETEHSQEVTDFFVQIREIIYTQQEEIEALKLRVKDLEP